MTFERERDDALAVLGALLREEDDTLPDDPLLAPFTEAERRELADAVMRRLGLASERAPAAQLPDVAGPGKRRRRAQFATAGTLLAAAATALLMLRPPDAPLPRYRLEGPPPERVFRDDESAARHGHTLGRNLELVLRPATRTAADVKVRAYVARRGQPPEPFTPRVERLPGGVMLLRARTGTGGELAPTPGTYRLVLLLGTDEHALDEPASASERGTQRLELELEVRERQEGAD